MTPKKTAAPFLWFSFCFGNVLEAVVLGSVQYPSDNGLHSHLDARGPAEASASSRNDSTSVHVPSYMISLYRTLSELDRRGSNGSQTRSRRYANTVTSFIDLGQGEWDWSTGETDRQIDRWVVRWSAWGHRCGFHSFRLGPKCLFWYIILGT